MQNKQCLQSSLLFQLFCTHAHYSHTSHTGHTVHPQILYINVSTLRDEIRRPSSVELNVSHLIPQSKYDTKYIALLFIASHVEGQRKIAATADKKLRARYSDKDEH